MFGSRYWLLLLLFSYVLSQTTDKDEDRPYKFGFNIQGYQHRQEEKDERGLIKGEYGFITADGYYRVTVYATDENGDFKILSMKNYYVGFPPEDPTTTPPPPSRQPVAQPRPSTGFQTQPPVPGTSVTPQRPSPGFTSQTPPPRTVQGTLKPQKSSGLPACSDCSIPVPTEKPSGPQGFGNSPGSGGFGNGAFGGSRAPGSGNFNAGGFGQGPNQGLNRGPGQNQGPGGTLGGQGGPGGPGLRPTNGQVPNHKQPGFPGTRPAGNLNSNLPNVGQQTPNAFANPQRPTSGLSSSTGPNPPSGQGQLVPGSPNTRPKVGEVRDGLPPGVTVDDIKKLFYKFNYTTGFHGHLEYGYRNGDKEGDYFFDGRDGVERRVVYLANEFGYQPNITFTDLPANDVRIPKEETEKEFGLKGYEFKWFYRR